MVRSRRRDAAILRGVTIFILRAAVVFGVLAIPLGAMLFGDAGSPPVPIREDNTWRIFRNVFIFGGGGAGIVAATVLYAMERSGGGRPSAATD